MRVSTVQLRPSAHCPQPLPGVGVGGLAVLLNLQEETEVRLSTEIPCFLNHGSLFVSKHSVPLMDTKATAALKKHEVGGAWLAHSLERAFLDLEVGSSSPTLGGEVT